MSESNYMINNVESHIKGVLWYEDKPVYIVEVSKQYGIRKAIVYEVSEKDYRSFKVVRPAWRPVDGSADERIVKESIFSTKHNKNISRKTINVENPPLFTAPILESTSTISNTIQEGFYERVRRGNTSEMVPSGAFIGMDDITWEDNANINLDDLVKELSRASKADMYEKYGLNNHKDGIYF